MLDIKFIRQNADLVKTSLKNRGTSIGFDALMEKDNERRGLIQKAEELKAARNQFSMKIAKAKGQGGDLEREKAEMRRISDEIKDLDTRIRDVESAMEAMAMEIPNIPHESVPVGSDPTDNLVVRSWGEKRRYDFTPKDHWEVGENLGILDFKRAAKITGARFTVSWGLGSRLERALINF
ncbi:MAG TPA: serine--tRNA ligase, partial [Deltaproteobacteria bacterium]|nr:serine--tRNA ligase [Deltaproteobacteria bacterium]HPJ07973.1 serine--tRNA ligase [Deltaproteobacteria bacterium]